jgi:hypothetical protein
LLFFDGNCLKQRFALFKILKKVLNGLGKGKNGFLVVKIHGVTLNLEDQMCHSNIHLRFKPTNSIQDE